MSATTINLAKRRNSIAWKLIWLTGILILKNWLQRARQRRQLLQLTREQLDDIGVSVREAEAEAAKPMWRV